MSLAQDAEIGGVAQAEAAADGRAERHHGCRACIDQALGVDDVVGGVGQNGEAFLDQDARGFERGVNVGIERGFVADDLDLDPVGEADFAAEARGANGLVGSEAACGVGQKEVALRVEEVEQRLAGAVEVDAADGDGDHFGAGGFDRGLRLRAVFVLPCSDDEARLKGAASDDERFHRGSLLGSRFAGCQVEGKATAETQSPRWSARALRR